MDGPLAASFAPVRRPRGMFATIAGSMMVWSG